MATKKKTTKKKVTRRKASAATGAPTAAQIKRKVKSYIKEQTAPLTARLKKLQKDRSAIDKEIDAIETTLGELKGAAVAKSSAGPKPKKKRGRRTAEQVEAVRKAIIKKAGKTPKTAAELLDGIKDATTADLRALTASGDIVSSGRGRGTTYTGK